MSSATVRSGFDTWVYASKPSTPYAKDKYLTLRASVTRALIYFASPAPRGATITKATLRVYTRGASSGARTLTVQRIASSWKVATTTWNSKPTFSTTPAPTAAINVVTGGVAIDFDVTAIVQGIANGASNFGFQIVSNGTAAHMLYGIDSGGNYKPTLTVEWEDKPSTPTSLVPSDGVVGEPKPTLQCDYTDVSGNTTMKAIRVQIDPAGNGTTPAFDSGAKDASAPQLDLEETSFPGLTAGALTQWRVQVQDGAGLWSDWSDWTEMTYVPITPPTITSPSGGVVRETTPPIVWTSSGQTAWQVIVYDQEDTSKSVHNSGKRTTSETSYALPAGVLKDERPYLVEVRVWDAQTARKATAGVPIYSTTSATFVVADDPSTPGVTNLAASTNVTPAVVLDWSRTEAPDSWTIYEDGLPVVADLPPGQTTVSGTAHRFSYYGARPDVEHTYSVRAVVNGRMSAASTPVKITTSPHGLWLVDPDDNLSVTLWGDDEGTWNVTDDASVYTPINSSEVVRIVSGLRGLDGSLSGYLMEGFGKTFAEQEAALYRLKSRPVARLRLVASDVNIEVLVGNLRVAPRPTTRKGRITKSVSFDFWQVGDLPFDRNV